MHFHRLQQSVGYFVRVAEMAWDVLSGAAKWHGMFCPWMFCPRFKLSCLSQNTGE